MSKVFKSLLTGWFVNLILFTVSLFLYQYYLHVESWLSEPWTMIFVTAATTKGLLSIIILYYGCNYGIDGKKVELN